MQPTKLLTCVLVAAMMASGAARAEPDMRGARGFDFEFGSWTTQLRRLDRPLTGSDKWIAYEGISIVHPLWDGRANIGELKVSGSDGEIVGSSYRLYEPESGKWFIRWANARTGTLGEPMIGGFDEDGVGLFYNQEMFGGRPVFVRFTFSDVSRDAFRFEQAFSADGGKTWEPNWIARFRRTDPTTGGME